MSDDTTSGVQDPEETATAVAEAEETEEEYRLSLEVEIEDAGPCRKHVRIRVPQDDISHFYEEEVSGLVETAEVPGFRVGHVPKKLVEKRFRKELAAQVKQKVLIQSLEQVSDEQELEPISEPNLDVDSLEIPEEGDFEFEFDIEVRPDFDIPDYDGIKIERPVRDITDAHVDEYKQRFLQQYATYEDLEGAAQPGDYVTLSVDFRYQDRPLHKIHELKTRIKPVLRFQDAELEGFDTLMTGLKRGDVIPVELTVSTEAENIEMRGEPVQATFSVKGVRRLKMPELNHEFYERIGFEDAEELDDEIRATLKRQVEFQQRQACRRQVLEKITESADWELPEELVLKQVENALRREVLEMQQAGFTPDEIRSRENEIRQRAVSNTEQALKEHFVLDKIATREELDVTPAEIDTEIQMMAIQRGESARRVRARLEKSGMDENLAAQIRERKAVDFLIARAEFTDVPMEEPGEDTVAAVGFSVCGMKSESAREEEETEDGDE